MGEEPVGGDETTSVTVTMTETQVMKLRAKFPDARNDAERLRRASWLVTEATTIRLGDGDETE